MKKTVVLMIVAALIGSAMKTIDQTYTELLSYDGNAQGIAGEALASFCLIDEYLHDAIGFQDEELRAEIFAHPSRKFLQAWVANGIDNLLQVFIMKDCSAVTWTMETNFEPKKTIELK